MTRNEMFKIGMAIHKIAMSVDDDTLERIGQYLDEIENIVAKEVPTDE